MSVYARLTEAAKWNNGENMCDVNMAAAHIERHPLHRTLIHTHICRQIYIHVSASSTGTLTRGSIFPANTCGATFSKYWFLGAGAILRPSNAPGFQVYTDDKWHQVKPINHLKAVSRGMYRLSSPCAVTKRNQSLNTAHIKRQKHVIVKVQMWLS